jgi:V8-like Glu-specific endopeptidase
LAWPAPNYLATYSKFQREGWLNIKIILLITLMIFSLNALAAFNPKAIYADDNRTETTDELNRSFRPLAKAVAVQISKRKLRKARDKYYFEAETFRQENNLCKGVPFATEKVIGECTGFLIAEDVLVTAGHCLDHNDPCSNSVWSFDFHREKMARGFIYEDEVYSCQRVIEKMVDSFSKIDYAVIKLDRPVENAVPLKLSTGNVIPLSPLVLIGHPNGLSAKIASQGRVLTGGDDSYTFKADVDAFVINSGSPIVNKATQEVVGMLIRGIQDFTYNRFDQCYELNVCSLPYSATCQGETVLKSYLFEQYKND